MKISIPQPCHENWQNMTAVEKGRFCSACQKKVHDFTNASDHFILNVIKDSEEVCGLFLPSQLGRELSDVKKSGKSWIAVAASTLLVSSVSVPSAYAQTEPKETHANRNYALGKFAPIPFINACGVVKDEEGALVGDCTIIDDNNHQIGITDAKGYFSVEVQRGTTLTFNATGYVTGTIVARDEKPLDVKLEFELERRTLILGGIGVMQRRTFFGRIFHSIGKIFN